MNDFDLTKGLLEPVPELTLDQIDEACEAAMGNARELLEESELLRSHRKCPRTYLLAHIACEEVAKLPILITVAFQVANGLEVDWRALDRSLRSHPVKIKHVRRSGRTHRRSSRAAPA